MSAVHMTKTFRLETLKDALDIATTLTQSWFRGHSRVVGRLVPRLLRPQYTHDIFQAYRPDFEAWTIERFKRHAPLLTDRQVPAENDRFGWLCLMQHYRMPTRLLDWTENALWLYFLPSPLITKRTAKSGRCCRGNSTRRLGRDGIPLLSESPHVKYLLREPYWADSPEKLCQEVRLRFPVKSPVAIEPPLIFPRMTAQASTFTIHPTQGLSIPEVLTVPKYLVRYVVPARSKGVLSTELRALGFTEKHLFPDLEGLARMIGIDEMTVGYGPPDPPPCSGEVMEGDA